MPCRYETDTEGPLIFHTHVQYQTLPVQVQNPVQ